MISLALRRTGLEIRTTGMGTNVTKSALPYVATSFTFRPPLQQKQLLKPPLQPAPSGDLTSACGFSRVKSFFDRARYRVAKGSARKAPASPTRYH